MKASLVSFSVSRAGFHETDTFLQQKTKKCSNPQQMLFLHIKKQQALLKRLFFNNTEFDQRVIGVMEVEFGFV